MVNFPLSIAMRESALGRKNMFSFLFRDTYGEDIRPW